MKGWKCVGKYLKAAKWEFAASNLLAVLDVICVSYYPWLLSYVIDHFDSLDRQSLSWIFVTFIISILAILAVSWLNKLVKARYEQKVCGALRRDIFAGIIRMDYISFHSRKNEDYTSFLISDIDKLYGLYFENLIYLAGSILMMGVYAVILASLSWQMCLVIMGSLVLILLVPRLVGSRFQELNNGLSAGKADYLARCAEVLAAHDLMDDDNRSRLLGLHNGQLEEMQGKVFGLARYRSFVQIFSGSALYLQLVLCFVAGLVLAHGGSITVGIFASSLLYAEYVAQYSSNIVDEFLEIRSSGAYRSRCMAYLNVPEAETGGKMGFDGLVLDRVCAEIGEKSILRDTTFRFETGKKYLIQGANGTGKSTLLKTLAGLLPPASGRVLGTDRGKIGYIPQRRYVFEGTLLNNITLFAQDPGEKGKNKAAELCRLVGLNFPLEYEITRNGENLSGGEAAKICLIRELFRERDALLIDEPMNDVDEKSQADILNVLLKLEQMVIVVAHGLGDTDRFDKKLFLMDGALQ